MMEIFGSNLSDDLFSENESKNKNKPTSVSFLPKVCEPQWFLEAGNSNVDGAVAKYKAEFFYMKKDFHKSSELYKCCLNSDETNNCPFQRDCLEGLSRSLLKTGSYEESLKYASILLKNSCNNDQTIVTKSLMALISHGLGNYKEELEFLQECSIYHPFYADLWLRIALCYANINEIAIPLICCDKSPVLNDSPKSVCPEIHTFNEKCSCLTCPCLSNRKYKLSNDKYSKIICACLIRSNLLYQGIKSKTFAKQRKQIAIEKTSLIINSLQISPSFIEIIQKKLYEEFNFLQDSDSEASFEKNEGSQNFEEKWFKFLDSIEFDLI